VSKFVLYNILDVIYKGTYACHIVVGAFTKRVCLLLILWLILLNFKSLVKFQRCISL